MARKIIAVCGCSFLTSSYPTYLQLRGEDWPINFPIDINELPKKIIEELKIKFSYRHFVNFLDLYAQTKNFEILYFSEGGASNFGIRVQIDKAMLYKPDFFVIGATESNRFELTLDDSSDFVYSTKFVNNRNNEIVNAAIKYHRLINNNNLNNLKSFYFLESGLTLLKNYKIPFVFLSGPLRNLDWSNFETIWPLNKMQPWDILPNYLREDNHYPIETQYKFCEILIDITKHWS